MTTKLIPAGAIHQWVEAMIAKFAVHAPQARGGRFAYAPLERASDLRLDHDVTILPPRKYLMPQREALLRFDTQGKFESVCDCPRQVLLGVHPYDVAAIMQMDRYFSQDNPDAHYLARRAATLIIACDVQTPSENVFAGCMNAATVDEGYDVLLTLVGDAYAAQARTAAGEQLLSLAGTLKDADAVALGRREQAHLDAQKMLRRQNLRCESSQLPALLEKSYDHPIWQTRSEACYSCGSCVMVCPSCFCFDVKDDVDWNLNSGTRHRQWDSCLLSEFALVAGGHNFRKTRAERYRHRYFRKGSYLPGRCGFVGCVGCGRCVGACTTNIANPVAVFNSLMEEA
jgi:ferredoxin